MNTAVTRKKLVVLLSGLFLSLPCASSAEAIVVFGNVVDRSTIEAYAGDQNGQLSIKFCFGAGLNAKFVTIVYKEPSNSPAKRPAMLKLAELLRDPQLIEITDPHVTTAIGLSFDRVVK